MCKGENSQCVIIEFLCSKECFFFTELVFISGFLLLLNHILQKFPHGILQFAFECVISYLSACVTACFFDILKRLIILLNYGIL